MILYPKNSNDLNGIQRTYKLLCLTKISSITSNSEDPDFLLDDSNIFQVCSENKENSSIIFTFPLNQLILTNYSVAINPSWFNHDQAKNFPKRWILEAFSNNKWINISYVEESHLNTDSKPRVFNVHKNVLSNTFKITHLGPSYQGSYFHFCLYKIDYFGIIFNGKSLLLSQTCKINKFKAYFFACISVNLMIILK